VTPDPTFWGGKRVLLTGHTGFKGAWLALWLHRLDARVRGFALPPDTNPNLFEAADVGSRCDSLFGDVRRFDQLTNAITLFRPDIVFHLAAQSLVQRSYLEPVETYETNVMGTINLLEAVRRTPSVRAVVVVTSDKCYENREWVWAYREDEALGGYDPYSSSKACAEIALAAWRRSFLQAAGVGVASARAGNVIGGGDWAKHRLIPDCIRALASGKSIAIRNPQATRPWQHVLEAIGGYMILAERLWADRLAVAEAWNFGPDNNDVGPVHFLADRVTALWGNDARWMHVDSEVGHEASMLSLDSSKARVRLGWRPRLRLPDALEWTVVWYKRHNEGASADTLVFGDIERYETIQP
jgi:CDP-glucose 4,6-dehydratase